MFYVIDDLMTKVERRLEVSASDGHVARLAKAFGRALVLLACGGLVLFTIATSLAATVSVIMAPVLLTIPFQSPWPLLLYVPAILVLGWDWESSDR